MLECKLADQVADLPSVMTSNGQEWQFQVSYKQINWQIYPGLPANVPPILSSGGQILQIYPRSAGRCTPHKCIMGYILWDAFGSHFGFFKKRWEFSFISE